MVALTLAMCVASVGLYWPLVQIGLLADDFALLEAARNLELASSRWEYLRPFGLLLWSSMTAIAPEAEVARGLHLLNALLHGLNAALVGRLATNFGLSTVASLLASVLFLVSPIAVEPVAWCSGMFDVVLTTLALVLCLVITRNQMLSGTQFWLCSTLALLMLGTKETGVIAGPLTLVVHWSRWGFKSRSGYPVSALLTAMAIAYAAMRHLFGRLDTRLLPTPDLEALLRLFTQSFGTLVLPLHDRVLEAAPAAAFLVPAAFLVLFVAWAFRWRVEPGSGRLALLAAATVLIAVAPALAPFGIAGDLRGSRYLYLPSSIWVIAIAKALIEGAAPDWWRVTRVPVAAVALVAATSATLVHFDPWREASRVRDTALFRLNRLPQSCLRVHVRNIPDHADGAYVFRNGLTEGASSIGRTFEFVREEDARDDCRVDLADPRATPAM